MNARGVGPQCMHVFCGFLEFTLRSNTETKNKEGAKTGLQVWGVECCFIGAAVLEKPQISKNSAAAPPPPPDSRKIVCWPCGGGFSFLCTFKPHETM